MVWTTENELYFISKLGTHFDPKVKRTTMRPTRKTLLSGYIKSLDSRSNWAGMDRNRIVAHAITCYKDEFLA